MVGSCECGNELSVSLECREYIGWLRKNLFRGISYVSTRAGGLVFGWYLFRISAPHKNTSIKP